MKTMTTPTRATVRVSPAVVPASRRARTNRRIVRCSATWALSCREAERAGSADGKAARKRPQAAPITALSTATMASSVTLLLRSPQADAAGRLGGPALAAVIVWVVAVVVLGAAPIGLGMLLTHVLLPAGHGSATCRARWSLRPARRRRPPTQSRRRGPDRQVVRPRPLEATEGAA